MKVTEVIKTIVIIVLVIISLIQMMAITNMSKFDDKVLEFVEVQNDLNIELYRNAELTKQSLDEKDAALGVLYDYIKACGCVN